MSLVVSTDLASILEPSQTLWCFFFFSMVHLDAFVMSHFDDVTALDPLEGSSTPAAAGNVSHGEY